MGTTYLARQMGTLIKDVKWNQRIQGLWYSPHMAVASRAISERIPLVDLIVELRDARVIYCFYALCLLKITFP